MRLVSPCVVSFVRHERISGKLLIVYFANLGIVNLSTVVIVEPLAKYPVPPLLVPVFVASADIRTF